MSKHINQCVHYCRLIAIFTVFCTTASFADEQQHCVLLTNGQVLRGAVSQPDGRTVIELPNGGAVRLTNSQVAFIGRSLEEIYLYQRARKVHVRASEHLELADWCFAHKLLDHAETHITQASVISPEHPGIQMRARRLTLLRTQSLAPTQKTARPPDATIKELQVDVEKIVNSLPSSAIQDFVRHVQPILLKNCSTARCHDSSGNHGFALIKPTFSNTIPQRYSRRNLVSTISVIDESKPLESPLVKMALTAHATTSFKPTAPLPSTETGQWKHLRNWLLQFKSAALPDTDSGPLVFSKSAPYLLMQRESLPQMPIPPAYRDAPEGISETIDPFDPSSFNTRR